MTSQVAAKILAEENIVCQQKETYTAIKLHRDYDYWLYIPRVQKSAVVEKEKNLQLSFNWSES